MRYFEFIIEYIANSAFLQTGYHTILHIHQYCLMSAMHGAQLQYIQLIVEKPFNNYTLAFNFLLRIEVTAALPHESESSKSQKKLLEFSSRTCLSKRELSLDNLLEL